MDLSKVTIEELRGLEPVRIKELEESAREELMGLRMDSYIAGTPSSSKGRKLKRTIARLLTVKGEKQRELTEKKK